ncbi:NAD-dependent succinate-semialdehyde dehydrogenase [Variovorax sp. WS11]|uniref:NAD-dependent succinate-semialdehyde dehydrogenase n=1 Tax=Variovorax sp. WS11 TaxID=1105204 RepID=UPI000D0D9CDF|nr:NAD-dependent succinate-semialdehyde dehydrogenase [Variovorax sp. WS11]NDZ18866.1 NAD-dependent succinate-semialdehyde dehydrogenase [Variovorax sp. WS11]PSL79079.1 NAD-dependent succinate-semialdehyde dehydrogenase [Variovorax sp. WS11]
MTNAAPGQTKPDGVSGYPRLGLYIDGNWIYERESWTEVRNPSDESLIAQTPRATKSDLALALDAAQRGFLIWRDTAPEERVRIIQKAIGLLRERSEAIARIITLEHGKVLSESRGEVARSASFLDWNCGEALRMYGTVVPSGPRTQRLVIRQPIGPVAAFTPWNVPLSSPSRKVGAALSAGCSIVLKAAEETPGAACALVQCFADAGVPPGVLNLVFGDPAQISSALIASPVIRLVTLTGSVEIGKHLTQQAGAAMKPVLMELGGHAAVIVCDGVDASKVGRMAAKTKMRVAGQICASPSRFIIHRNVYEEFVSAFASAVNELRLGDGLDPQVQMGPLANGRRLAAVQALVDDAKNRGARVAAGGHRVGDSGYFFAPTVLAEVPLDAAAMTQEPFGPVAPCVSVASLDEAIQLANSLPVGLAGYAFTNSLHDAERITRELECGVLFINNFDIGPPGADLPFGGVKDSGIGREGGSTSLDAYTISKTVLQSTAQV